MADECVQQNFSFVESDLLSDFNRLQRLRIQLRLRQQLTGPNTSQEMVFVLDCRGQNSNRSARCVQGFGGTSDIAKHSGKHTLMEWVNTVPVENPH